MANKEHSAMKAQEQPIPSDYPAVPKPSQGDGFRDSLRIMLLVLAMVGLTLALGYLQSCCNPTLRWTCLRTLLGDYVL